MKPVKLEFIGLNSFSERAVINFAPLLAGGIFGIFGETGSGKSTILDAINFALYGDIERNSDKLDKINFRSEELSVSFTFDIFTDGARRTYLVERSIKKKSGTHKAMLYEIGKDSSIAIADNVKSVNDKITDIIGISKEDFRKCIALPQGEFAQFVNSAPADRIELIERLFGLEKYGKGLKNKLSSRDLDAQGRYNKLEGELNAYTDVSEQKLEELKARCTELSRAAEKLKAATEESDKNYSRINNLFQQKVAYESAVEKLKRFEERKPWFDELGKILPALSASEKACEKDSEAIACGKDIARLRAESDKLAEQADKLNAKLEELTKNNNDFSAEEANKAAKVASLMKGSLSAVRTYRIRNREYEKCREDYKEAKRGYDAAASLGEQKAAELKTAQARLAAMAKPDLEELFKKELRGGILREEYARALANIKDLQAQMRTFDDRSPLYEFVNTELGKRADEYRDLILAVREARGNVKQALDEFDKISQSYKNAQLAVTKLESEAAAAAEMAGLKKAKMAELRENGEKVSAERSTLKAELENIFGADCEDYETAVKKAEEYSDSLQRRRAELERDMESARKQLGDIQGELKAKAEAVSITSARKSAAEKDSLAFAAQAGLTDIAACRALIEKYGNYDNANAEYIKFTADYAAAKGAAAGALPEEEALALSKEDVDAAFAAKKRASDEYSQNGRELAVATSEEKAMISRLAEKKELEKKFAQVSRERDLIGKLRSLIRDNKFMEYIAAEHLVNISHAASRTLIDLTDGRYYLSYTDNNFCVGDNYNGGELRKVKTLSGGETFLVSLSLALALSDTICRRSMKSIEFFFLDEGFGTLDGDLIDTVLSALEKLKNDNFSIGLISHVEELQHRISSKILVSKATETHGSTIKVSC